MKIRVAICLIAFANTAVATNPGEINVFDYGIASRGPINLTGGAGFLSANNNPAEASVLSGTYSNPAITMSGNARIAGDVYLSSPDAYATVTQNASIGGKRGSDPAIYDHIHLGVGNVQFPEVDPTVFEPFATNIVDKTTSTSGAKTFTNIRIAANTNPTFNGNITINGMVFVEQPNKVTFNCNLYITGMIVSQDAGDNNYTTDTIKFFGNTITKGVEFLPDTPEFHDLRQMPGSFLLAPGFGVTFSGTLGGVNGTLRTVNGCMAADAFNFNNLVGSTIIDGPIINYSDTAMGFRAAPLTFDLAKYEGEPPGFISVPEPATIPGDANRDGKVNFADYLTLELNWAKTGVDWDHGDFNNDGKVSFADYLILEQNFRHTVPEPAGLSLLAMGGLAILRRRRYAV